MTDEQIRLYAAVPVPIEEEVDGIVQVCRTCRENEATLGVYSGLETHPYCQDCAAWCNPTRFRPLSDVDPNYVYADG